VQRRELLDDAGSWLAVNGSESNAVIIGGALELAQLLADTCRELGFHPALVALQPDSITVIREQAPRLTLLVADEPGPAALQLVRSIRAASATHLIMLSVLSEPADVLHGFDAGADDFLTLPVRPLELRARIGALTRRSAGHAGSAGQAPTRPSGAAEGAPAAASAAARNPSADLDMTGQDDEERWLRHGSIALNQRSGMVLVDQREIRLSPAEFDVLATLLQSKRRVRNLSDLALVMRGKPTGEWYEVDESEKARVDACIFELRRKLGDTPDGSRYIERGPGAGYRLSAQ